MSDETGTGRRMRIYIAGLYSSNLKGEKADVLEVLDNIRIGLRTGAELMLKGQVPFCPWLDFLFFIILRDGEKISMKTIKAYSMEWLRASEAILLLPGWEKSSGARAEYEEAKRLGLRVFNDIEEVPNVADID